MYPLVIGVGTTLALEYSSGVQRSSQIRSLLASGDRRTIGRVPEILETVLQDRRCMPELLDCLSDSDSAICMRAADVLEKVSRTQPRTLDSYTSVLLNLFAQTEQQEIQWHLAVILPRLHLNHVQRLRTGEIFQRCLLARSSIVKTFALQGLFDLSLQEASLKPLVVDLLRMAEKSGTPAMKARSRKLLGKMA